MTSTSETTEPRRGRLVLTVEEAAELLGVGRITMYGLIQDGAVESVRIGACAASRPTRSPRTSPGSAMPRSPDGGAA